MDELVPAEPALPLDLLDHQQAIIEQLLLAARDRVLGATEPLREATEVMQEAIAARIDLLVARTHFTARWVMCVGGVLVNGDPDMGSFHAPRRAVLTDRLAGTTRDLLPLMAP